MTNSLYDKPMAQRTTKERHEQLMSWLTDEAYQQADNRRFMALCEAFYDNEQWDADEARDIEERGQRATVYNEVGPTIDFLIGTERRARVDFVVAAQEADDESEQDAQVKTKLLKALEQDNNSGFERSEAAKDAFTAGIGWLCVGLRGDATGPSVITRHVSWRNVLHDRRAKRDLEDARYLFYFQVVDLDVALAAFPGKEAQLRRAARMGDDANQLREGAVGLDGLIFSIDQFESQDAGEGWAPFSRRPVGVGEWCNPRPRVMLIEAWTREPVRGGRRASGGTADLLAMRVNLTIMTEFDILLEQESPYRHDRFPFVPLWAYRHRGTGLPYSPVLRLIGPQIALNQRMSKALWEASANQIELEAGAISAEYMDLEELRTEYSSPDGMAVLADGALSGGRVRTRQNDGRAQAQLALAERDIMHMQRSSGVNEEARGLKSGATSRVAMDAKFERASITTTELFDNVALARKWEGEITLSLVEQYMLEPRTVRLAQDGMRFDRVQINQPGPDGQVLNDISARRASFVIGEAPWKQSYSEAAFASIMDVLTQLAATSPRVVEAMLDVVFEMHPNLPRKAQILERIRSVTGQSEPGAKLTPEQQAQKAQQEQVAKAQFEAQMAQLMADITEAQAKGQKLEAEAMRTRMTALYEAAQAAQVLAQVPAVAPMADELLRSAGFKDMGGQAGPVGPVAAQQPVPQAQPLPPLQQADGIASGIETPAPDGVLPQ